MAASSAPNVWAQMNYVPPRGQCNFKPSVLYPKCPCLRFMLHPLKSSSSYECDGCNHHASFHSMENKAEDEVRKRWEIEARDKARDETMSQDELELQPPPRKRLREIEFGNKHELENLKARAAGGRLLDLRPVIDRVSNSSNSKAGPKKAKTTTTRGTATKVGKKATEYVEVSEGESMILGVD